MARDRAMRSLFWQVMVSLDGYFEGPKGELDWHATGGELGDDVARTLEEIDAILLGRRTWQRYADSWPTATAPEAAAMNAMTKIVFSRTLSTADWANTRLVRDDAFGEVAWLKRRPGRDLAVFGSAEFGSALLRKGLVDELRILVSPVVLGAGKPLFRGLRGRLPLRLSASRALPSGVVVLTYRPSVG